MSESARLDKDRSYLPLIAITMGDPAGIGPEIIAKAFTHADTRERARMVVVGDVHAMEKAVKSCDLPLGVSAVLQRQMLLVHLLSLFCKQGRILKMSR